MAMENVGTTTVSSVKSFLYVTIISILAVTLIVLAMPNTERPLLPYEVGNPWTNPQLISPGEFVIKKDPAKLKQERELALQEEYVPIYTFNQSAGETNVAKFVARYNNDESGLSAYAVQTIAKILTDFYDEGIMSQDDYNRMIRQDSLSEIMLTSNKMGTRKAVREILNSKRAYEKIFNDKRIGNNKEVLSKLNLNEFIVPNIVYDEKRNEQAKVDILAMVSPNEGIIKPGQEIINRGDIVTEEKARMIDAYNDFLATQATDTKGSFLITNSVQWLYVMMLMVIFMIYMQYFRRDYLTKPRSLAMVFTLITLFPIINSFMVRLEPRNIYIVPFCLLPMFVRVFLDSRTGFMAHLIMVLICAAAVSDKFEFIMIQLVSGLIAISALKSISKRSQLFVTALLITIAGVITYTLIKFLDNKDVTFEILKHNYIALVANGVLLLLTYPLMFIVEKAFGFISPVTLIELSDVNRGVLRKLSEKAPGTFQHSIMVSNLASAIAAEVGAKSTMVRTGALYHDIGKMDNALFFTENQKGYNPHSRLTPQESAQIIIKHVSDGIKIAKAEGIPDVLRNFILTHHGKSLTKYFYNTYKNEHPDEEVDEAPFRYPGPNPFSKEQAILMMADAVEAASRSLPEYSVKAITNLVNRIVDSQVAEGYFNDCPITFHEITKAKEVLIQRLTAIYHSRTSYPELVAPEKQKSETADKEDKK